MLTRIEIDGFKSFEGLAIDFLPFTLVVGNNAAGKSNLFDAIQLVANLASTDVAEALKNMRGEPLEMFRQTASGRASRIKLAVEVLVDPVVRDPWGSEVKLNHTRMRYEITLERRELKPGIPKVLVAEEAAYPILKREDRWAESNGPSKSFRTLHLKYARTKPLLTTDESPEGRSFSIHQDGRQGRNRPASAAEASVLSSISNAEFAHLFALREEMKHWRLLQLDPALLRRPSPATSNDLLEADGRNLAAVLAQLKAESASEQRPMGVLNDIVSDLNDLIPGVSRLDADLHKASQEYRIELTMRDGLPFSSKVVSDGTLRVLALLTLLHDPRHRGLICFEEPENGVHPGRIKPLVRRLREMVTMPSQDVLEPEPLCQLMINSHSPVVLSALLDQERQPIDGMVLFADTSTVSDPLAHESRRRTRLRPVRSQSQGRLFDDGFAPSGFVSDLEVSRVLETIRAEG
ncbi:MAG: AAA family ATPase [Burkholderiales bacterium]|nr:AAA family ATPase [Burkholderiales bacterium]